MPRHQSKTPRERIRILIRDLEIGHKLPLESIQQLLREEADELSERIEDA